MKWHVILLLSILLNTYFASAQWALTGNAGTVPATNFLGTKDNQPLRLRVNNIWAGELNPTTGNVFLGRRAGIGNKSGFSNIALGTDALKINATQSNLVAIGDSALFNNTGGFNIAIGSKALYSNLSGNMNTAVGYQSLYFNIYGAANTAAGDLALYNNVNGYNNTATGTNALKGNTSGNDNASYGAYSMLLNTTGTYNTTMGDFSLYSNSSGNYNVAAGAFAMVDNTYGTNNVGIGVRALAQTTGSQYNTAIGYNAGVSYDLGYNNTILGANSGGSFAGQYNIVAIGQSVICPDNSTARIGNAATWSIGGYAGWSQLSDGRYKKDVQENVKGLEFIMKLRPVTYHVNASALSKQLKENNGREWDAQMKKALGDKEKILQTGFIAQEVEQAAKDADFEFSGVDKPRNDTGIYALRYAEFVVPLVKAIQEQQQLIKDLQNKVQTLQDQADITILMRETFAAEKMAAYPDPVASNMTVTINTQTNGNGTLQIFDSAGKLVKQMAVVVQQGNNTINLSLPTLAAGYYTLKMDWGSNMHKQISFVKTNQ